MKTEINSTGWTETTVKKFIVLRVKLNFYQVAAWAEFHRRNVNFNQSNRTCCNICKKKWDNIPGLQSVNLAIIKGVGNRVICQECTNKLNVEKFT